MRSLLKIAVGLTLVALVSEAQSSVAQENSPKEVVERFCKTDADGKRLKSEDQKEVLALLYEQKPSAEHPEIVVVGNYVVVLRKKSVRDEFASENLRETLDCSH